MTKFERHSKPGAIPPAYIDIKESKIPGSGKGAFANCDIPAGTTMGEYLGKIYKGSDMDKATGSYLFSVRKNGKEEKIIDGKFKKYGSWVRYINSPQTPNGGNAFFYQHGGRIYIKSSKLIPAGQEIYAHYGEEYVNEQLKPYFTKENKPKVSKKPTGIKC